MNSTIQFQALINPTQTIFSFTWSKCCDRERCEWNVHDIHIEWFPIERPLLVPCPLDLDTFSRHILGHRVWHSRCVRATSGIVHRCVWWKTRIGCPLKIDWWQHRNRPMMLKSMSPNRLGQCLHRMEIAYYKGTAFERPLPSPITQAMATKCTSKSKRIATTKHNVERPFHVYTAMKFLHASI